MDVTDMIALYPDARVRWRTQSAANYGPMRGPAQSAALIRVNLYLLPAAFPSPTQQNNSSCPKTFTWLSFPLFPCWKDPAPHRASLNYIVAVYLT